MISLAAYDRVVSEIYDAALVPASWDVALTSLVSLFAPRDWEVAMLVWERLEPPMGRFIGAAGVNQLARDSYLNFFAGRHEWTQRGHHMELGRVAHSDELIARDQFVQTPFYEQYLGPWGFEVALIGILDRHNRDHMGIVCPGPPDQDPGDLREAIIRLTPHFQRAARISRRIGEADLRAATASSLLDHSPYAVLALGPGLELLFANSQGQALLDGPSPLRHAMGAVRPDDPAIGAELAAMAKGQGSQRVLTFSLEGVDGQGLLLSALAVDQSQSGQFANQAGGATVMLVGGQRIGVSQTMLDALQQGFDLTSAEARLAAFLINGSGVEGYAKARGVSINAGKYLLKGIYAKTGLTNQTELVALLREAPIGWGAPLAQQRLN